MSTAVAQFGLVQWANTVRLTMAEDHGRQSLKDQIQQQGFLFLDDYFDGILEASKKQDPLIELVKTPGRKKTLKRTKLVPSKLSHLIMPPLDDDYLPPLDAPLHTTSQGISIESPNVPPTPDNPVLQPEAIAANDETFLSVPNSGPIGQKELSIIVEADESPDRESIGAPVRESPRANDVPLHPRPDQPTDIVASISADSDLCQGPNATSSTSIASFHSVSLDSPDPQTAPLASLELGSRSIAPRSPDRCGLVDDTTGLLSESRVAIQDAQNMPSAESPTVVEHYDADLEVPLRSEDASGPSLTRKSSMPVFPMLPEPAPLRKSIRGTGAPSYGPQPVVGLATPALAGDKRTSWLKKAREVKAMEETNKLAVDLPSASHGSQAALRNLKRKSGDLTGGESGDSEPRRVKASKSKDGEFRISNSTPSTVSLPSVHHNGSAVEALFDPEVPVTRDGEYGIFDAFKKTMQGLGTQAGRSTGKSLGGTAVAVALAEAKAAAEAKIAERERQLVSSTESDETSSLQVLPNADQNSAPPSHPGALSHRLSISELVTTSLPPKLSESSVDEQINSAQRPRSFDNHVGNESVSTTPPDSPPSRAPGFAFPSGPVFNKPTPVFVPPSGNHPPPSKLSPKASSLHPTFSLPVPMSLGLNPLNQSSSSKAGKYVPLSGHSTVESLASDRVFSSQEAELSWMPSTQDTEYMTQSQSSPQERFERYKQMDEDDDSWPVQDPIPGAPQWPFSVISSKDDSMTWSTLPTQSQRGDTGPIPSMPPDVDGIPAPTNSQPLVPGAFEADNESINEHRDVDEEDLSDHSSQIPRSQSQLSDSSAASSQSQGGFFNQATKLVHSVLGTSKKGKPEVKSLQLAAAAARKQQEESEKKVARLKEMENRRQLAIQRKAEEEKAKAVEAERKLKEDTDRRKREREEHTDKRPIKSIFNKKDEDTTKKRKITVDAEKKPELKKLSKPTKPSPVTKLLAKPTSKTTPALTSSTMHNTATSQPATSTSKLPETKLPKTISGTVKGKSTQPVEEDGAQPSQLLQSQMAARAKAQLDAARAQEPAVPSEAIELPDINSEYSDSDDEDRPRTYNPPSWAQSPELRQALLQQETINPDDIFGAIRPLRMEEIFRTRNSRFRARTSSANWTGTDRLTVEEEREYARRMGYR